MKETYLFNTDLKKKGSRSCVFRKFSAFIYIFLYFQILIRFLLADMISLAGI